ncbi:MFS transporter [Phytoactinopolyspora limicola]|uniref:MFS transporter n=1 Tax=Phytoactinopolyspora limicola TaxID=2715536 RepID=UPI00140D7E9B|nr:aromatic acid/H+ symport family MFS transporter [Phytoactinopolyspora limicola]
MSQGTTVARPAAGQRSAGFAVLICFVTIVFDGYDLVVYGTTLPSILAFDEWGVTPDQAGVIGSYALIGMLVGALVVGAVTDILGRRKVMLFSVIWFSLAMVATAAAPNAEVFGLLRFVAGIGLGGVVPTAVALTVEYSPRHRRQLNNALMFSGFFVGAILSALVGMALLPDTDFRVMYLLGGLPLVTVVPIAWRYLPESITFLRAAGRHDEAARLAAQYGITPGDVASSPPAESGGPARRGLTTAMRPLFARRYVAATFIFAAASFCGLLLVYGLNTWLPKIMNDAGHGLGSSLSFLLALNIGGIVGTVAMSHVADRIGVKVVAVGAFLLAAGSIVCLSADLPYGLVFVLVAAAGTGTGTQILINGYVATHYPDGSRASALGWSLGTGRLGAIAGPSLGGFIVASTLGYQWNFYLFAGFALLGCVLIAMVPRRPPLS